MAFPVPSHLPRQAPPQDVSSKILTKISQTTSQTLNASLASSWLAELDETIQSTRERIHERIHSDLPYFERQLESSKSVQTRLHSLADSVDVLNESVSNPETGIIPTLVQALTTHSALAQDSTDATVNRRVLSHLLECRSEYRSLISLVQVGKLPDAVGACQGLEKLLDEAPEPLNRTQILTNLKSKFRAAKDRTQEQLSEAYSRSIVVTATELVIRPCIQIRQSETVLSLPSVLSSLSPSSLSSLLTTLRRDLTTYYIDRIVKQAISLSITIPETSVISPTPKEHKLTQFPSPPNSDTLNTHLENLSTTLTFLSTHLFPFLPLLESTPSFQKSLVKPITTSILNNLIIPHLPSSYDALPPFIHLLRQAVEFEEKYIVGMLEGDNRAIKEWADGVAGHYERKRRIQILENARNLIVNSKSTDKFHVEIELPVEAGLGLGIVETDAVPVQGSNGDDSVGSKAWNLADEDENLAVEEEVEENGWGFDDDDVEPESPITDTSSGAQDAPDPETPDPEPDPADAWGWNEDDDLPPPPEDEGDADTIWDDDPWADGPADEPTTSPAPIPLSPSSPKVAKRLERFSSKGKGKEKQTNSNGHTNGVTLAIPQPSLRSASPKRLPKPKPASLIVPVPKESYVVSGRMKQLVQTLEDVLHEGHEFASSTLFSPSDTKSPVQGTLLLQSASSVLDLFRALYPIKFGIDLNVSSEIAIQFSNDCLYICGELRRLEKDCRGKTRALDTIDTKLVECKERFQILANSWFDDTIEKQRSSMDDVLTAGTEGFTYTAEQDRYDDCESAVNRVLQDIRRLARSWKNLLPKSKYYTAIGLVADAALSRILEDILALPDIPEVESHRLSELCRILHALEGLFVEDPDQPSFIVAYVPSWLKFSYLSELLEASMADITYLFEEGALVDFEVEELAFLVRALFADTPLRATTISKLMGGHPAPR